jgi:hypothetical protein
MFDMVITYFCVLFHFICFAIRFDDTIRLANTQAKWEEIPFVVSATLTCARKIYKLKLILHMFRL